MPYPSIPSHSKPVKCEIDVDEDDNDVAVVPVSSEKPLHPTPPQLDTIGEPPAKKRVSYVDTTLGQLGAVSCSEEAAAPGQHVVVPQSFHQAAMVVCLDGSQPIRRRLKYFTVSTAIVLLQIIVQMSITLGIQSNGCKRNEHCIDGFFCQPSGSRCAPCEFQEYCGDGGKSEEDFFAQTTLRKMALKNGKDYRFMCEACYDSTINEYVSMFRVVDTRMELMRLGDWLTLFLSSMVIAFSMANELRDIRLCEFTLLAYAEQGGITLVDDSISWRSTVRRGRRFSSCFWMLISCREYVLLPWICMTICYLIVFRGGGALDVCLNAVAVVFLLEIDNSMYNHLLPERTRKWLELRSRVSIEHDSLEERRLEHAKTGCVLAGSICIPGWCLLFWKTMLVSEDVASSLTPLCYLAVPFSLLMSDLAAYQSKCSWTGCARFAGLLARMCVAEFVGLALFVGLWQVG
eukprot:TRINITY_DN15350_c0_g1_i5.p1 TRINITY_DN15350_c0_g1~~TRINITY_DN15350_c0_g1_i5.p1  ORF type:complete len:491 (+),score=24.05 TRINITY_DN15350_c0_g1_i5:95-1474(+)